jgi:hypothetical protein
LQEANLDYKHDSLILLNDELTNLKIKLDSSIKTLKDNSSAKGGILIKQVEFSEEDIIGFDKLLDDFKTSAKKELDMGSKITTDTVNTQSGINIQEIIDINN